MLQAIQNKSLNLLDSLVNTLEQYEDVQKRPKVFAEKCLHKEDHSNENAAKGGENSSDDVNVDGDKEMAPSQKFKSLSFELIDIGLFHGQKGLNYIKQTPAYTMTDRYIHYDEKYQNVRDKSVKLY